MGSLFLRGKTWWIKYYRNGKSFRESSGSTTQMVAKKMLARREGEIALGKLPGVLFEKVTFDELANDFLRDYKINQKKSLPKAQRSVFHLKKIFTGLSSPQITTEKINSFIEYRMESSCKDCEKRFMGDRFCPFCGSEKIFKGATNVTILVIRVAGGWMKF